MKLYVVTTNLPGPPADSATEVCEFVELEDENGFSHGWDIGVGWSEHPQTTGLHCLGPFVAAKDAEALREARDMTEQRANGLQAIIDKVYDLAHEFDDQPEQAMACIVEWVEQAVTPHDGEHG